MLVVKKGFTLIEVMVVVLIIGLLAAIVAPQVRGAMLKANNKKVLADFSAIESALQLYHLDNAMYPTSDQGLEALVKRPFGEPVPQQWKEGGYLQRLPKDPWKRLYRYESPSEDHVYEIYTLGSDDMTGGEGQAADMYSRDESIWE